MSDISEKDKVIKVAIFGEEYPIRGYANKDHILRVAECVDRKMREIALKSKNRSANKIAVLTALNLADELIDLKDKGASDLTEVENRAKNILEILDNALPETSDS
jgi:cell division protein ZapA